MIEHFAFFVKERENIRKAKEAGLPAPWTADPILGKYRFCNIRRRDDRVSKWLIENMYVHIDSEDDAWFIAAIARYINWPPMLAKLLENGLIPRKVENFDHVLFGECVDDTTRDGGKAWSGAYMTFPCKKITGQPKGAATAQHILAPLVNSANKIRSAIASNRLENIFEAMVGGYGWQSFMVGQVVADLTYTPQLSNAEDLYTWAPMGPGSQRGLNRLYKRPLEKKWKHDEFNSALISLRSYIVALYPETEDLTLHDWQNVCCEVDKMLRAMNREGEPRSIYKPETAF